MPERDSKVSVALGDGGKEGGGRSGFWDDSRAWQWRAPVGERLSLKTLGFSLGPHTNRVVNKCC